MDDKIKLHTLRELPDEVRSEELSDDIRWLLGEIDKKNDEISFYDNAIRNLDALAESVRHRINGEQDAEDVADEIVGVITDLEGKVGDIT